MICLFNQEVAVMSTQDTADAGKLITPQQAAELRSVSRPAIYAAIAEGRLASVRVLGRIGVREADALAYQPVKSRLRPDGIKGRGGKPRGIRQSVEARQKISEAQKRRWATRKAPRP